jgi:hypothetical protein
MLYYIVLRDVFSVRKYAVRSITKYYKVLRVGRRCCDARDWTGMRHVAALDCLAVPDGSLQKFKKIQVLLSIEGYKFCTLAYYLGRYLRWVVLCNSHPEGFL